MMPMTGTLDPGYLLLKAYQLHGLAEVMSDSWYKRALQEIAQIYELLADGTVTGESRSGECDGSGGARSQTDCRLSRN